MREPGPGEIYIHWKHGTEYQVLATAKHSETGELLVIYYAIPHALENQVWCRPLSMWWRRENDEPRFKLKEHIWEPKEGVFAVDLTRCKADPMSVTISDHGEVLFVSSDPHILALLENRDKGSCKAELKGDMLCLGPNDTNIDSKKLIPNKKLN